MTAVILVTLALGIGADTALFSVINGVLLQDLPYPDSRQIYLMRSVTPDGQPTGLVTPREARPIYENENHPTVEAAAIAWDQEAQIVGADGRSHLTTRYGVTDQFFEVFGPQMAVGRGFERGENPGVAVLAYSTWRDMFGSDPDIVGKVVQLDPGPSPVVGVVPQGFEFPSNAGYWWLMRLGAFFDGVRGYEAYLRLRPDRTHDGIQADLTDLGSQLGPDPTTNQPVPLVAEPLLDYVVGDLGPTVTILFGATGILLLIACINVTNLLLSRVTARSRELALREAVGAGRWRIIRQVVTEGLLLSMIGGLLGLGMALAGIRLLLWAAPGDLPRLDSVAMDGNVLLFTLGVTILVGVLVATAPAWRLARNPLRNLVNEAGRGAVIGGVRNRLFSVLVVAEVGLAVLLVIGAGLLVRSYQNLIATDLNFNPNGLLAFSMNVPGRLEVTSTPGPDGEPVFNASYAPVAAFFRELTERVAGIAGVEAVATTSSLPLKNIQYDPSPAFRIVGQTGQSSEETVQTATSRSVNPDFLPTMQIRLLAGRNFAWSDGRGTPGVAIVNETFARRFFPGQDAPGQRLRYAETQYTPGTVGFQLAERTFEEMEIVGIVEDVKYAALAEPAPPSIYLSSEQWTYRRLTVVVRSSLENPESLIPAIQAEMESMDPLVTAEFTMYPPLVRASIARERLGMTLLVAFGSLALLLAAVGIYGLMSYSVTQRTGEIAVRSALGASAAEILGLILKRGVWMALVGIVLGGVAAIALGEVLASQLYQVSPLDLGVFVSVPLLLLAVAVAATFLPANRARKIDPAEMLRRE